MPKAIMAAEQRARTEEAGGSVLLLRLCVVRPRLGLHCFFALPAGGSKLRRSFRRDRPSGLGTAYHTRACGGRRPEESRIGTKMMGRGLGTKGV